MSRTVVSSIQEVIPKSFTEKKSKILSSLRLDNKEYQDRSPKGSVDEGCRELIEQINSYDGLVTTSSCAGRISVFVEGPKSVDENQGGGESTAGGKGGGKWLFMSHDPVDLEKTNSRTGYAEQLGMVRSEQAVGSMSEHTHFTRLVRLAFEPLILHVMTASLKHAQPLLSAAINAGFRESGVQSLKNLEDVDACPMVAIRTKGLKLETLIGVVVDRDDGNEVYEAVMNEGVLRMLLKLANDRFVANEVRKTRLSEELKKAMEFYEGKTRALNAWEDKETRRLRKVQEGLTRKARIFQEQAVSGTQETTRDFECLLVPDDW